MRRLTIIVTLCVGCWLAADAQTTFTERLQKSNAGEGQVTITQDKSIDKLVNTPTTPATNTPSRPTTQQSNKDSRAAVATPNEPAAPGATPDTTALDGKKKVMKGYKVSGYRVQVFAGGNSRNDRVKAERAGEEIKALFPGEPVYVHFYSPRWICRMGNYRTYEEAHEILSRVKNIGFQSAIIVKGKITVQYP